MNECFLKNFTTNSKATLNRAGFLAKKVDAKEIEPEHLLIALVQQPSSLSSKILGKIGINSTALRRELIKKDGLTGQTKSLEPKSISPTSKTANEQNQENGEIAFVSENPLFELTPEENPAGCSEKLSDQPKLSLALKKILQKAILCAATCNHRYIGTEHILHGLLSANNQSINQILLKHRIKPESLLAHLQNILVSTSKFSEIIHPFLVNNRAAEGTVSNEEESEKNLLSYFANDLTGENFQKNIDPLIGRTDETSRLVNILSRRTKNNPLLIGEPGVGKTAIVEGLARRIFEGNVPAILLRKRIIALDLGLLISGTIYRGEFENRLKQVIEMVKNDPEIILFIDEIHTIIGAGSSGGSLDAANLLKPALAKGQIRLIGATTLQDYKKYLEPDPALDRRFQTIFIEEPTAEETIDILRGIRKNYEDYHQVKISDEAIESAVALSERYLKDKFLPDKAIDLLDEAASQIKIQKSENPLHNKLHQLEKTKKIICKNKERAVRAERFDQAMFFKKQEEKISASIQTAKQELKNSQKNNFGAITAQDVAEIISRITKLPAALLSISDKQKFLNLEKTLKEKIIGQDEAVSRIAQIVRKHISGLAHPERPIGSFLFCGPSGVGKTELANVLARAVFNDKEALIRFDMSEFAESFNLSKLIGAPAGYVGYRESGKLTEAVKNRPYSLVLFDEIEKAHPDVYNLLLQVLENGRLTDATGKEINFRNTIIIMTSNVGTADLAKTAPLGFETQQKTDILERIKEKINSELKKKFNPEFLNRVDALVIFKPLEETDLEQIINLQFQELTARLIEKKITFNLAPKARDFILHYNFNPNEGARGIRKTIADLVENPLAEALLRDEFLDGDMVKIERAGDKLVLVK